MAPPDLSVVVPTAGRPSYLAVALRSLTQQNTRASFEVVVVDDGDLWATGATAERIGARVVRHGERRGLNAARNTGLRETSAPLVAFLDDDVLAPPGWVEAVVAGARRWPEAEAFGGPIRARLEGGALRGCGEEDPPITTLYLGPEDKETDVVWGANFALRRSAVERVGEFDESIDWSHGDEEEWLERLCREGGEVVYLPAAGVEHRREPSDSTSRALSREAWVRGRGARRSDSRRHAAPGIGRELRVLGGCLWHAGRRRCPYGLVMAAHSAGRVTEALRGR
ncbi:MAG TPA: glycosyltransferase family 2 protein [Thermoleophilaceae bacterium]|nr:glycosyltransferase family 2 protein [Thermoleophilaceae bacterium]